MSEKKYIGSCGWKYQVMPELGENTFDYYGDEWRAYYRRPEEV